MAKQPRRSQEFISKSDESDSRDENDDDADFDDAAPAKKKPSKAKASPAKKPATKKVKRSNSSDEDDASNDEKEAGGSALLSNKDGDAYLLLSKDKRVTVRKYKNNILIDIRETYNKDGEDLPGKKGISLTKDQFKKLVENVDEIQNAVDAL